MAGSAPTDSIAVASNRAAMSAAWWGCSIRTYRTQVGEGGREFVGCLQGAVEQRGPGEPGLRLDCAVQSGLAEEVDSKVRLP